MYLEESKRILTCCPFNLAYSRHSLGHDGNVLAKGFLEGGGQEVELWLWIAIATPQVCKYRVDLSLCSLSVNEETALAMTFLKAPFFSYFQTWRET